MTISASLPCPRRVKLTRVQPAGRLGPLRVRVALPWWLFSDRYLSASLKAATSGANLAYYLGLKGDVAAEARWGALGAPLSGSPIRPGTVRVSGHCHARQPQQPKLELAWARSRTHGQFATWPFGVSDSAESFVSDESHYRTLGPCTLPRCHY